MKSVLITTLLGIASAAVVNAAAIRAQNFSDDATQARPIVTSNGNTPPANSGSVTVGSFRTFTDAQIQAVNTVADLQALLADFVAFANSLSNPTRIGSPAAADAPGLYAADLSAPINAGDPLVGKSIYTLIGNGSNISTSNQLAVVKDDQTFNVDAPVYQANAFIYEPSSVVLVGSAGPSVRIDVLGANFESLRLRTIPEPSMAMLGLLGLGLVARRRR